MIRNTGVIGALLVSVVGMCVGADGVGYTVYQTCEDRAFREVRNTVPFSPHRAVSVPCLDLDDAKVTHEFKGLGVSFAEASCKLLAELPPERRRELLDMVFSKNGAGVSMGRIHVGCSDYSAHIYTYDDVPDDIKLEHFSIDPDRKYVIPAIKEAQKVCPDLYFCLFGGL